ncbi:PVC-type heme-binding CxxCH protein [Marinimicrobium agarilyticum]|uniref:PVC-type heme-binding CxxCH protein n=1 Tax=Marinimicrobium agarilyticum TaxID=306546 RepID=UPI00041D064B|nr:PVC-type heme-binding CxxCH protein [Marinimicrobium agarilyticum]
MSFTNPLRFSLALLCVGALTVSASEAPEPADAAEPEFKGDRDGHEMRDVIPKRDIPSAPILNVEQALERFQVQPGFVIEPVAAEPSVFNPVALAFDARGRMWVAEMTTYMPDVLGTGEMEPNGNIAVLEDTNGDGEVDKRTVFLSDIVLPRTVSIVEGGIFYADQSALYFAEVREEDGRLSPGLHEVVDAEYAKGGSVEHKPNAMLYGMDHWYYNARSDRKYQVLPHESVVPSGAEEIYRNPYWKLVRARTEYRGQWGLSMDDYGRLYHNGNSSPIHGEYLLPGALRRNPGYWPDAAAHPIGGHQVHPARMNPGVNRGYMEGVLVPDGPDRGKLVNFTAASGSLVYRGSNFPPEYYGMALTPEPAANLVTARRILEREGLLAGEPLFPGQELLTSTDERFRPVNLYNAPDGTLYLVDMYHGILQHREFLTSYLAAQIADRELDKNNNTMGRIYRLRWRQTPAAEVSDLTRLSPDQWVPLLGHPNAWHRDTARRLLVHHGPTPDLVTALKKQLRGSKRPFAIINILWTLRGLNAIDLATVKRFIQHEHDWVAITAAAVGEALPPAERKAYRKQLMKMAKSGYPRALQAAVSVAAIEGGFDISRFVLKHYETQPYGRAAVVSGLGTEAGAFIASLEKGDVDEQTEYLLNNLGKRQRDESNRAQLSAEGQTLYDLGKQLFNGKAACASCHGSHGNGQDGVAPTLWETRWVRDPQRMVRVMLHGLKGPIMVGPFEWSTPNVMPGFAARPDISDKELAAVATYIRNSWGNAEDTNGGLEGSTVTEIREATEGRSEPYTAKDFQPMKN